MKTEWMLTNAELKVVANCELDTLHPWLACDRTKDGLIDCQHCPVGYYCGNIAMAGKRKLLEYLIESKPCLAYSGDAMDGMKGYRVKEYIDLFKSILKQLEEK